MKKESTFKKNPLSDKLLAYSAAAGAVMALGSQAAKAQINYTDVDPDVTLSVAELGGLETYSLDINNDGTEDMLIMHNWGYGGWYDTWKYALVYPQNLGGVVTMTTFLACSTWSSTFYFAARFEADDVIGPEANFNGIDPIGTWASSIQMGWGSTAGTCSSGPWQGDAADSYLAVSFSLDDGATTHYGWVRLSVADDVSGIIIKDYAYEETVDTEILAGAGMPSAVRDVAQNNDVQVYSFDNNVVINAVADFSAEAEIFNAIGQRVKLIQVREGRTEIQVNQPGIYMVRLSVDNEMITQKVVIQ